MKVGGGQFLGTTYTGGTGNVNQFGIVHRLTEGGSATTVAAFPRVLGTGFNSELNEGSDGQLYGTTHDSRTRSGFNPPAIPGAFKISTSGAATSLAALRTSTELSPSGQSSRMVPAGNGDLFGTVSEGGAQTGDPGFPITGPSGFIYRIRPSGTVSTVYQFTGVSNPGDSSNEHGETPQGALTPGPDSQLYGTTFYGGAQARGTFFKVDAEGNLTTLASFNDNTGMGPTGDLIFSDGHFYGRTSFGGDNNTGTFFTATPEGQITRVMSFPANQHVVHNSRLILARDGNFYGVLAGGVFRLSKAGEMSIFATMDETTGNLPRGVIQATDGNFYGVTSPLDGNGCIFRVSPSGDVDALVQFDEEKGHSPAANLFQASDGHLYGTTTTGGPSRNGVVYRLRLLPAQFANISTRLGVGVGENVLIGGFIINGTGPKNVIVRAIGSSLAVNGVPVAGRMEDPQLELFAGPTSIAFNDNWRTTQEQQIIASTVPPTDDREAAIVAELQPGNYTAIVRGKTPETAIALVEVYDLNPAATAKLANISTRGFIGAGDTMIGGLIVRGAGDQRVIVRAMGPTLEAEGVSRALQDPTLELFDGNGNPMDFNNNWQDDQQSEIEDSGFAPGDARESAIITDLPSGNYTALVRGAGGETGVALVEVYRLQ